MSFAMLSEDVSAKTYSSSRKTTNPGAILLIQLFVVIAVAVGVPIIKHVSNKSVGNNKSDPHIFKSDFDKGFRDGFGNHIGNIEDILQPRNSDGLTEDEQLMVDMFAASAKARKPDPVEIKCPNCGAPVMLSDKVICPYCRSEITNRTVAKHLNLKINNDKGRVVISPKDYNPNRYYDENLTGYGLHDLNNEETTVNDHHRSFDSGYGFVNKDPYGGSDQSFGSSRNSYSRRNNSSGSDDDWGSGFSGGDTDKDHR